MLRIDERAEPSELARPVRVEEGWLLLGEDRDPVDRDLQLDVLDPTGGAGADLLSSRIGPGGIRDVRLTIAELGEAVTGAGALDRVVEAGVGGLEGLRDTIGDRLDGGRATDEDLAVRIGCGAGLAGLPGGRLSASASPSGTYGTVSRTVSIVPSAR